MLKENQVVLLITEKLIDNLNMKLYEANKIEFDKTDYFRNSLQAKSDVLMQNIYQIIINYFSDDDEDDNDETDENDNEDDNDDDSEDENNEYWIFEYLLNGIISFLENCTNMDELVEYKEKFLTLKENLEKLVESIQEEDGEEEDDSDHHQDVYNGSAFNSAANKHKQKGSAFNLIKHRNKKGKSSAFNLVKTKGSAFNIVKTKGSAFNLVKQKGSAFNLTLKLY